MFAERLCLMRCLEVGLSFWESLCGLDGLDAEQRGAEDAFDWVEDLVDPAVDRNQVILGDEDPVAGEHLVVGLRAGATDDFIPTDRQDLVAAGRRRSGNPDVLARQPAQATHLADGVQDGLIAGDREPLNIVAEAGPFGDHVIHLAVVGVDVDRHERRFQILR